MKKGATLMGTESPDLLLEEYRLVQQILAAENPEEAARIEARHEARSRCLLGRRDQYIARRLNESLRAGETGLLFLGMLHSLDSRLAKDIRVSYPIRRPPHPRRRTT
jgi:Na+/phosphate symporter